MRTKLIVVGLTLLLGAAFGLTMAAGAQVVRQYEYKMFKFTPTEFGVACLNGNAPTVHTHTEALLIVSCGE